MPLTVATDNPKDGEFTTTPERGAGARCHGGMIALLLLEGNKIYGIECRALSGPALIIPPNQGDFISDAALKRGVQHTVNLFNLFLCQ
jgi:hypothetical protein